MTWWFVDRLLMGSCPLSLLRERVRVSVFVQG